MKQIYIAGYSGHTPQQLRAVADSLGAMVVDIRLKPKSRVPGWNRDELGLSQRTYTHFEPLGNLGRFDGGPMRLKDEKLGIESILRWASNSPIILLCGCADSTKCHRTHISKLLAPRGIITKELIWPEVYSDQIKAISLWQPYASLISIEAKRFETRSWGTKYRGPIAIHAAKNLSSLEICGYSAFRSAFTSAELWNRDLYRQIPYNVICSDILFSHYFSSLKRRQQVALLPLPQGAIVATAEITDCLRSEDVVGREVRVGGFEHIFGDYSAKRFAWKLENVKRLDTPIPFKGAQGFFNVDLSLFES